MNVVAQPSQRQMHPYGPLEFSFLVIKRVWLAHEVGNKGCRCLHGFKVSLGRSPQFFPWVGPGQWLKHWTCMFMDITAQPQIHR